MLPPPHSPMRGIEPFLASRLTELANLSTAMSQFQDAQLEHGSETSPHRLSWHSLRVRAVQSRLVFLSTFAHRASRRPLRLTR